MRTPTFLVGLTVLLLTVAPAAGQAWDAGVKAGLQLATITIESDDLDKGWRTGATAGGYIHFPLGSRIGFQPEVLLAMNGARFPYSNVDHDVTLRFTDLEFPLLLKLRATASPRAAWYVLGGVTPIVNLHAEVAIEDLNTQDIVSTQDISDTTRDADVGVTVGSGVQGRHWLVEARFTAGLRAIATDAAEVAAPNHRRAFAILGGWRF